MIIYETVTEEPRWQHEKDDSRDPVIAVEDGPKPMRLNLSICKLFDVVCHPSRVPLNPRRERERERENKMSHQCVNPLFRGPFFPLGDT